jgi:hypothetical protein
MIVFSSDVAQLVLPESQGPFLSRAEKILICSLIGGGLALLLVAAYSASKPLSILVTLVVVAVAVFYPVIREACLDLLSRGTPGQLELEMGHPRVVERLRFTFLDPEFTHSSSSSRSAEERACQIYKAGANTAAVASESGVLALPRFLESDTLGHDWVIITYRNSRLNVRVEGLRSGGLHSARLKSVVEGILKGAEVIDDRERCHELWPFAVRPFEMLSVFAPLEVPGEYSTAEPAPAPLEVPAS